MKQFMIKGRTLSISMHIMAWLLLIILPQIIINHYWGNSNFIAWGFYLGAAFYGIIFYINYLYLVPQYFLNKRKTLYFILAFVVIASLYLLFNFIDENVMHHSQHDKEISDVLKSISEGQFIPRPPMKQMQMYYFLLISVIITGFSIGLRVIEEHTASEKLQKELEKEKLHSELAFLKNQVSPHFFFNTLNNIYSLVEINSDDAQDAILKLSKLMRYLLYESEHEKIDLDSEIDFMNHYIDLMKLRLSERVDLKIDLALAETNIQIPPLLFIPFIENAFKHGVSFRGPSFIDISMHVENNRIKFICNNSIGNQTQKNTDENHSGIGLENVRKRLNLLFPDKHVLNIEQTDSEYKISLDIEII